MPVPLSRLLLLLLLLVSPLATHKAPAMEAPPVRLPEAWPPHPRLLITQAEWDALAPRRAKDPEFETFVQGLLQQAEAATRLPPLTRTMTGKRLLHVSRELLRRVLLGAFAWRVTGDRRHLDQARGALLAATAFSDWNPSHFLDVAEACTAVAIGYDWLHHELSPEERRLLRTALIEKGLNLVKNGHPTFEKANNWGQVCAAGLSLAALAVGDEEPDLAAAVLRQAQGHLAPALAVYAPDGAYPEGPNYWAYGTSFEVLLLASLRSALGEDWHIPRQPGFMQSAIYYAQTLSPGGCFFNYADCPEEAEFSPALFYLARALGQPDLLTGQKTLLRQHPERALRERLAVLACFWWPESVKPTAATAPLNYLGRGPNPVAIWRSSWSDPSAAYFAIKAGGAGVSHGHMDGGSFVYESGGVRWALDPGMQDYESLESKGLRLWDPRQESDRWKIFRLGSLAHNTLTLGGRPHRADGLALLVRADQESAEIDLTPVFLAGELSLARRRAWFSDKQVRIEDRLEGVKPGEGVRWTLNTRARVELSPQEAVLEQDGRRLRVRFAGHQLQLRVLDRSQGPADYDAPNPGLRQLVAESPAAADGTWQLTTQLIPETVLP